MNSLKNLKSEIKILLALVGVVIAVGGTLLVQEAVRNWTSLVPAPAEVEEPFNSGDWNVPLSMAECKKDEHRTFVHELGSTSIIVKGLKDNDCLVEYTIELEDTYVTYECVWAKSLSEINVLSMNIEESCTEISSGEIIS